MLMLLSFIAVILIVVSVHEYGHYLAARWCGVHVLRFSVGFGKPMFSRYDERGTEWVIAPILLGGYVQMLDMDIVKQHNLPPEKTIEAQSHWRRIFIYAAGPLANLLLSAVILLFLLVGGEAGLRPLVDGIRPASPAADIGMRTGEEIQRINGEEITLWRQVDAALIDALLEEEEVLLETDNGGRYVLPGGSATFEDLMRHGGGAAAFGLHPYEDYIKLTVQAVLPNTPAERAGIRPGDALVMIDEVLLEHWRDVTAATRDVGGRTVPVIVWRDEAAVTLTATPEKVKDSRGERGFLGITPQVDRSELEPLITTLTYSPLWLPVEAVRRTGDDVHRTFAFLRLLFAAEVPREQISGPIGIAVQSGEAASLGFTVWLRFVTLLSTSLGILNLLPLPLLDGGQIVLNVVQCVRRRDFSEKALQVWHFAGAAVILSLMAFVIINDILQFI